MARPLIVSIWPSDESDALDAIEAIDDALTPFAGKLTWSYDRVAGLGVTSDDDFIETPFGPVRK